VFSFVIDTTKLSNGPHILRAVATNGAGLSEASANVNVTVNNAMPNVVFTTPQNNAIVRGDNIAVVAVADDGSPVVIKLDGITTIANAKLNTVADNIANGFHTLIATATNSLGTVGTATINILVDNTAPSGSIVNAQSGDVFKTLPINLNFMAVDNINGSGIKQVRLEAQRTDIVSQPVVLVGTSNNAAGSLPWTPGNGTYTLTLTSVDVAGNSSSTTVTGVVVNLTNTDASAPAVTFTSPANNATVSNPVTLQATASDAQSGVASVQFYVDNILVGVDTSNAGGYSFTTTIAAGSHAVKAVAVNGAGLTTTSNIHNITVKSTAPSIQWINPQDGAFIRGTTQLVATSSDGSAVTFRLDNSISLGSSPFNWNTLAPVVPDGSHSLRASATDMAGNTGFADITVKVDNTAPTGSITSPTTGAAPLTSLPISINYQASDATSGVKTVRITATRTAPSALPAVEVGNSTTANGSLPWTPSNGTYDLTIVVTDNAGNTGSSTQNSIVVNLTTQDTTPPTASITAPVAAPTVLSGTLPFTATAVDAAPDTGIASVQFYVDDVLVGVDTSSAGGYTVSLNTAAFVGGNHVLKVVATNGAGLTGSSTRNVVFNNGVPVVTWVSPVNGAFVRGNMVSLVATANDNSPITFSRDGGTAITTPWDSTSVADGNHSLKASATNTGNVTGSSEITVTVDNTAPVGSITNINSATPPFTALPINVNYSASDALSGVAQVQLFATNTTTGDPEVLIGTNTTTTGNFAWLAGGGGNGNYTLRLQTTDKAGNSSNFTQTNVIVNLPVNDTTPPTVAITAPVAAPTILSGTVAFSAQAVDAQSNIAGVQFYVDNTLIATDTSADAGNVYTVALNTKLFANGNHVLKVVAVNGAGLSAAATRNVVFNNTNLSVTWVAPLDGAFVRGNVALTATASDASPVTFSRDGGIMLTSPWMTTVADDGAHTLRASATNAANETATSDIVVTVDNTAPTGTISSPSTAMPAITAVPVPVTWSASDALSGVAQVVVTAERTAPTAAAPVVVGTFNNPSGLTASGNFGWVPSNGTYTLALTATDRAGNPMAAPFTVVGIVVNRTNEDITPPTITITAPTAGQFLRGTFNFTATASDVGSGIAKVEFYDGSTKLGEDTSNVGGYSLAVNSLPLTDGNHILRAVAVDNAGLTAVATVAVIIDNTPPAVDWVAPLDGTRLRGTVPFNVTSSDATSGVASVVYLLDNATAITSPWNTTTTTDGAHTLRATAVDGAGNTNGETISVVVDNTAPTCSIVKLSGLAAVNGMMLTTLPITVDYNSNDGGTGVREVRLAISGAAPFNTAVYTSTTANGTFTTALPDGTYDFTLTVVDHAGNSNTTTCAVTGVVVSVPNNSDTTPPTALTFVSVAPIANNTVVPNIITGKVAVTVTVNEENVANIALVELFGQSTPVFLASRTVPSSTMGMTATYIFNDVDTALLPDGNHQFLLKVTNQAGLSSSLLSTTYRIDNTNPQAVWDVPPTPTDAAFLRPSITFQSSATDGGAPLVATATTFLGYFLDGSATPLAGTPGVSSYTASVAGAFTQGMHTIVGRWVDLAGKPVNISRSFFWDTVAPAATINSPLTSPPNITAVPFNLSYTASDAAPASGVASAVLQVTRTNGPMGVTVYDLPVPMLGTSTFPLTLPNGNYDFALTVTDKAGNTTTNTVAGIQVRVAGQDTTAPTNVAFLCADPDPLPIGMTAQVGTRGNVLVVANAEEMPQTNIAGVSLRAIPAAGGSAINLGTQTTSSLPFTASLSCATLAPSGTEYTFAIDTAARLPDGLYQFQLTATNKAGLSTDSAVSFIGSASVGIIDNTAPTGGFTAPSNNAAISGGAVTLSVAGSDALTGPVVRQGAFRINGSAVVDADGVTPGIQLNTTLFPDGQYTLSATLADQVGNTIVVSIQVFIDNNDPVGSINNLNNNQVLLDPVLPFAVQVSGNDTGSGIAKLELQQRTPSGMGVFNTVAFKDYTGQNTVVDTLNWSPAPAIYDLRLRVTDRSGRVSLSPLKTNVTVQISIPDTTPPLFGGLLTLTTGPAPLSGSETFTIVSTDPESGIQKVELYGESTPVLLSTQTNFTGMNVYTFIANTALLPDGVHKFYVRAYNNAGLMSQSAELSLLVDNNGPVVTWFTPAANVWLRGNANLDAGCADASAPITGPSYRLGAGPVLSDASGAPGFQFNTTTVADTANGILTATCTDSLMQSGSATLSVRIDNTVPNLAQITNITNGQTFTSRPIAVNYLSADALSGVNTVGLFVDTVPPTGYQALALTTTANGSFVWTPANGTYSLLLRVIDVAGNQTDTFVNNIVVNDPTADTSPPPAPIISLPLANSTLRGTATVLVTAATDPQSGIDGVTLFVGATGVGTQTVPTSGATYTFLVNTMLFPDGLYQLSARSTNGAGLSTNSAPVTYTIDNTGPVVSFVEPPTPAASSIRNGAVTLQSQAIDGGSPVLAANFLGYSINGGAFVSVGTPTVTPVLTDGTVNVLARWQDAAGNAANATRSFLYDNTNPTGTINAVLATIYPVQVQYSSVDATSGVKSVTLQTRTPAGMGSFITQSINTTANGVLSFIPTINGNYDIRIRIEDNAGNIQNVDQLNVSVTIPPVNDPTPPAPVVMTGALRSGPFFQTVLIGSGTFQGQSEVQGTMTEEVYANLAAMQLINDLTGAVLNTVDVSSCGQSMNTATCTPNFDSSLLPDGSVRLKLRAYNKAGLFSDSVANNFLVDNTAPTITMTDPIEGGFYNGIVGLSPVSLNSSGTDTLSNPTSFVVRVNSNVVASGMSPSIVAANLSAPYSQGNNTINVEWTDAVGNRGSASRTIFFDNINPIAANISNLVNSQSVAAPFNVGFAATDLQSGVMRVVLQQRDGASVGAFSNVAVRNYASPLMSFSDFVNWSPAAGTYDLRVRVVDRANNFFDGPIIQDVVVTTPSLDITPPNITVALATAAMPPLRGLITFTVTVVDPESGIERVELFGESTPVLLDTQTTPSGGNVYTFVANTALLTPDGLHKFYVKAYNNAGLVRIGSPLLLATDNTAPALTWLSPANNSLVRGNAVALNVASNETLAGAPVFRLDNTTVITSPWDSTTASNGAHTIVVTGVDAAGNSGTATVNITVDNLVPSGSITNAASLSGSTQTVTPVIVNFTSSDTHTGIDTVVLESSPTALNTWSQVGLQTNSGGTGAFNGSFNWLSVNGAFDLRLVINDKAGNVFTSTLTTNITINVPANDLSAPTGVAITGAAPFVNTMPNATLKGVVTIFATATETPQTNIAGVELLVDGNVVATQTGNGPSYSIPLNTVTLSDGTHLFALRATNKAGLQTTSPLITWNVDNTAPAVSFVTPPTPATNVLRRGSVAVQSQALDNGSPLANASFLGYSVNGGSLISVGTPAPTLTNATLPQGDVSLEAFWQDAAGNQSSVVRLFRYDDVAPTGSVTGVVGTQYPVLVNYSASDDANGSGIASVKLQVDTTGGGMSFVDVSTSLTASGTFSYLPAANSTTTLFRIVMADVAGNTFTSVNSGPHTITIPPVNDPTAPTNVSFAVYQLPAVTLVTPGNRMRNIVQVNAIVGEENLNNIAGAELYDVTGAPILLQTSGNCVDLAGTFYCIFQIDTNTLPNGSRSLRVKAINKAGASLNSTAQAYVVDNAAPVVSFIAPTPANNEFVNGMAVSSSASDADPTVTFLGFFLDGAGVAASTMNPFTISTWTDGTHTITARYQDSLGNIGEATRSIVWDATIPNNPNIVSINSGQTINGTTTINVAYAASDDLSGLSKVELQQRTSAGPGPWQVVGELTNPSNTGTIAWNPAPGTYDIRLRVTDKAKLLATSAPGNIDVGGLKTSVIIVIPVADLTPPVFGGPLILMGGGMTVNGIETFTIVSTDPESGIQKLELFGESTPVLLSTQATPTMGSTYTFNANTALLTPDGVHKFYVKATNNAGLVSFSSELLLTVDNNGPVVTWFAPPANTWLSGTVTLDASCTDISTPITGPSFSFNSIVLTDASGAPGFQFDTTTVANTNSGTLTATCTDNLTQSGSATRAVKVDNAVPNVVQITNVINGQTFTSRPITVNYSTADALSGIKEVQFRVNDGSGFQTLAVSTNASGSFVWTPANGTYGLRIVAEDNAGNTQNITVTGVVVNDPTADTSPPPAPVISLPLANSTLRGMATVLVTAANDPQSGIAGVTLFVGAIGVATQTVPTSGTTYTFLVNTVLFPDGLYQLSARSTNGAGLSTNSAPVTYTIDNTGPVVSFVNPTPAEAALVRGTVSLNSAATDNSVPVANSNFLGYSINGGALSSAGTPTLALTPPDGPVSIVARWQDAAGNTTNATRNFVYDNTNPNGSINAILANIYPVQVQYSSADATSGVKSVTLQTRTPSGSGSFITQSVNTTASGVLSFIPTVNGSYDIRLNIEDNAGNTFVITQNLVNVTIPPMNDATPPMGINFFSFARSLATPFQSTLSINGTFQGLSEVRADMSEDVYANLAAMQLINATTDQVVDTTDITACVQVATATARCFLNFDSSDFPDGSIRWKIRAYNKAGLFTENGGENFEVDNTPPATSWNIPSANDQYFNTTLGVLLDTSASDALSPAPIFDGYSIDGFFFGGSPITTFGSGTPLNINGNHIITARWRDQVGNVTEISRTVIMDNNAPTVANISNLVNGQSIAAPFSVSFAVTDLQSGIERVELRQQVGVSPFTTVAVRNYASPLMSFSDTIAWNPAAGTYNLQLRVIDRAGNIFDGPPVFNIAATTPTMDVTPPNITAALATAAMPPLRGLITFTVTVVDPESGIERVELFGESTPVLLDTQTTGVANVYTFTANTALLTPDGLHKFYVKAYNNAGLVRVSTPLVLATDNTAPVFTWLSPVNNTFVRGNSLGLNAIVNETLSVGPTYTFDGGLTAGITGATWDTTMATNGAHVLRVAGTDTAGNSGNATINVTVDNLVPNGSITSPVSNATITSLPITVNFNSSDAHSGVDTVALQSSPTGMNIWTQVGLQTNGGGTGTFNGSFNWLPVNDSFDLRIISTDRAGNLTGSALVTNITVNVPANDPTAPTGVAITGANPFVATMPPTLKGNVSVFATATETPQTNIAGVELLIDGSVVATQTGNGPNYTFALNTSTISDGTHLFRLRATNQAGGQTLSPIITWNVDNTAPTASFVTPPTPVANVFVRPNVTFLSEAFDAGNPLPNANFLGYFLDGALTAAGGTVGNPSFTLTSWSDGAHTIVGRWQDDAQHVVSLSRTINWDNTGPTGSITTPINGTTYPVIINYTSSDGTGSGVATVKLQVDPGCTTTFSDAGTNITANGAFAYTPPADNGYCFRLVLTDALGNTTTTTSTSPVTVTIPAVNDPTAPTATVLSFYQTPNVGASFKAPGSRVRGDLLQVDGIGSETPLSNIASMDLVRIDGVIETLVQSLPAASCDTVTSPGNLLCRFVTTLTGNGPMGLKVVVRNQAGLTATVGPQSYILDNTAPAVSYTPSTPANNAAIGPNKSVTNRTFTSTATDADPGLSFLDFQVTGATAFTSTNNPQTLSAFTDGLHAATMRWQDTAGNVGSVARNFLWDATDPFGNFVNLVDGQEIDFNSLPFNIQYAFSDALSGVALVELLVDVPGDGNGYLLAATSTNTTGSFNWNPPIASTSYDVRLRVTDEAGNQITRTRNSVDVVDGLVNAFSFGTVNDVQPNANVSGSTVFVSGLTNGVSADVYCTNTFSSTMSLNGDPPVNCDDFGDGDEVFSVVNGDFITISSDAPALYADTATLTVRIARSTSGTPEPGVTGTFTINTTDTFTLTGNNFGAIANGTQMMLGSSPVYGTVRQSQIAVPAAALTGRVLDSFTVFTETINHNRRSDLRLRLQGPTGPEIKLFDMPLPTVTESNINLSFSDAAVAFYTTLCGTGQTCTGNARPEQPLANTGTIGASPVGTWTLQADDGYTTQSGDLSDFKITFKVKQP
jgi:hypothetical protein